MQAERCGERIARLYAGAALQADLGEVQHGGEMTRLELERAPDVLQAFLVPAEKVVERSALVPRLGIERCAAQERAQPRFGDVVTTRGDVAGCRVQRRRGGAVRMVHPDVPDLVLGVERLGCG